MALHGEIGDLIEVNATHVGEKPRLGEILKVLGSPGHEHYQVRWEDDHLTLFYPSAGGAVIRRARRISRGAEGRSGKPTMLRRASTPTIEVR